MEMSEQKPSLKIPKGEIAKIKLVESKPFSQGEKEWDGVAKKWFGYNVTKESSEYVYFTSESVHRLIQSASPEGEFTLELRSVNNKEGQLRSIWYLDGKNIWQYEEEANPAPKVEDNSPPSNVDFDVSKVATDSSKDKWQYDIEERLAKLEKEMYDKTVKTDENIPF